MMGFALIISIGAQPFIHQLAAFYVHQNCFYSCLIIKMNKSELEVLQGPKTEPCSCVICMRLSLKQCLFLFPWFLNVLVDLIIVPLKDFNVFDLVINLFTIFI